MSDAIGIGLLGAGLDRPCSGSRPPYRAAEGRRVRLDELAIEATAPVSDPAAVT